jgi:tetratricopeptide (TPR) repeat protein
MVLSWTGHDERVYYTDLGINTGVMLKLAAQKDFTGAEEYKYRLVDALREHAGAKYYPTLEDRIVMLDQAFEDFRKSSEFGPRDAERFFHMARGYLGLMDATKRIQFHEYGEYTRSAAEEALKLEPALRGVNKTLGICSLKMAEREEQHGEKIRLINDAAKYFRKELQLTPEDPDCLKTMGFCFQAIGYAEGAIQHYKKYLRTRSDRDFEIESQLAWLLINPPSEPDERAIAEALLLSEGAYRHDPDDLKNCQNYSSALFLAGRIDEAVMIVERMIALDPANAEQYKDRIKDYTGSPEEAEEETGSDRK